MAASSQSPPIQRLLLVRNDHLGDLVLSLPAFAAARQLLPRANITALIGGSAAPLLSGNPHVDEVLLDEPDWSSSELARRLRQHRFDAALVMAPYTRNCLAVWRAGIPLRVTWAFKPAGFVLGNRRIFAHRSRPPMHESEFAMRFVRRLGRIDGSSASPPRIEIDPQARVRAITRIENELGCQGPLFGVHPGNFKNAYNWPPSRYAGLVSRLAEHGRVIVTGGPSEAPLLAEVRNLARTPTDARVAYVHDLSLSELIAVIAQMQVLTVSSTGPMHLAGALGTPVVALFSRHPCQSPAKWRPFGDANIILQPDLAPGEDPRIPPARGTAHMERISVEQVLAANLSCLQEPRGNELREIPLAIEV